MLLTLSTTRSPATDLGFLLHKNPDRVHSFDLSFGRALVFYPVAEELLCTVTLMLHVDPIEMVRSRKGSSFESAALAQYVNDRPYCANSFLSVAIADAFGTALNGRCNKRPDLLEEKFPLEIHLPTVPVGGGIGLLENLFQPLGYTVTATRLPLDDNFPEWEDSKYHSLELKGEQYIADALSHLYVLIPVLDNSKHYYVGEDEIEKLLNRGCGWLPQHPQKDLIVGRYLRHRRVLTEDALQRLLVEAEDGASEETEESPQLEEVAEEQTGLHDQRIEAVTEKLEKAGVRRILDLGCGEGKLIQAFRRRKIFDEVIGVDVSTRSLERAAKRLKLDQASPHLRPKVQLFQGALTYSDNRLKGYDAAVLMEVIEHVEPQRLQALEHAVFQFAAPEIVVITTPNAEYNILFPALPAGEFRHTDHRFEWTRAEFEAWATGVAERCGYDVTFFSIGPVDSELGAPTQMGIFCR